MPIYDYDGTTNYQIGKVYDNDGTTNYQIGKVYDNDGTTNSLIYTSDPDQFIFTNGTFASDFSNYTIYIGAGIEDTGWAWNKGVGIADVPTIANPMVLGWWYAGHGRNGYTFIFNKYIEVGTWKQVVLEYKKVHNGYYNDGTAAGGAYCYGTIGFLSSPSLVNPPPVTAFGRNTLTTALNTNGWVVADLPSGTAGYLFFSVFNTDSASGKVSISRIYFQ